MTKPLKYPESPRQDLLENIHGQQIADPYRWLENLDSEQTRDWVRAQSALTEDYLSQIPARAGIKERITTLWNYEKFGLPFKRGGRFFFTYNDGLQNQSALYWLDQLDGEPRLLLDPNALSEDGTVALVGYAVSPDGKQLAYGLSSAGSDWMEWKIRSVDTGEDLADHLEWVKFSGASWSADNQGFFYSRYDAPSEGETYRGTNYYHKLYYHRVGTPQSEDQLIYERPDQKEWGFGAVVSEDGRYLAIQVWMGTHRENGLFYKDLTDAASPVVELLSKFDASYNLVGSTGSRFYIETDKDAPLKRVIAIDLDNPSPAQWTEIIPETTATLSGVVWAGGRLFAHYLQDAHSQVAVMDLQGRQEKTIELPQVGSVVGISGKQDDPDVFYSFTSLTMPERVYHYDAASGQQTLFRAPKVTFNPEDYVTKQVFYKSKDGTRVPMFIAHKRDLKPSPETPTVLYGYGGFDIPLTPNFRLNALVWMEMGGIWAQANLRGGGEYGKAWHEAGMKLKKQNVFDDFIAGAEWLIAEGYTSTPRLAILGGSNGGLLVGACMTQRPDLYGAAIPVVGVLDMLRFHKFTIGWAWVSDYGSPDNPEDFAALLKYSPYHNLTPGTAYPPTLVVTGDHDDRVFPAHSFKFAAALQAAHAGQAPVLIRIETQAGHGMGKPTSKMIEEMTDAWTFLAAALNMDL